MSASPTPRPKSGLGWFIAAIVILAIMASAIFAPEAWAMLRGVSRGPGDMGVEPNATQSAGGSLATRDQDGLGQALPMPGVRTQRAADPVATGIGSDPVRVTTQAQVVEVAKPVERVYKDEASARSLLAETEKYYRQFDLLKARGMAERLERMDAAPAQKYRAGEINRHAVLIEEMLAKLQERDEMVRNYDTHPALVIIGQVSDRIEAVPLIASDPDKVPYEGDDALGFILTERRAGKVKFMLRSAKGFNYSSLPTEFIGEVEPGNPEANRKAALAELEEKIALVETDASLASDAMKWYQLARLGYRNRNDARVVEFLDRGLRLNSRLTETVRNERAMLLAIAMEANLKSKNQNTASAFMSLIRQRYADTPAGKQAAAVYEKREADAKALAQAVEQQRIADIKRQQEEAKAKTQALKDAGMAAEAEALRKAQEEAERKRKADEADLNDPGPVDAPAPPDAPAGGPTPPANGDAAKAQAYFDQAQDLFRQGFDAGPGPARNAKLKEAEKAGMASVALFNKLAASDPSYENQASEARRLLFGIRKTKGL